MPILLFFLALPIVEIALFVAIGGQIGVLGTLAQIFVTGAIGIALMRREPQRSALDIRAALAIDDSPARPMAHSALRLLGALLLAAPGFLTDALGLLLLLPPLRTLALTRILPRTMARTRAPSDDILDGDYTTADPRDPVSPRHRLGAEKQD
jgi:UPF0716 protein FxsA